MSENKSIEQRTAGLEILAEAILRSVHRNHSRFGVNLDGQIRGDIAKVVMRALIAAYEQGFQDGPAAYPDLDAGRPTNVFTVAQYLGQGVQYFSDSKGRMVPISTMPARYAGHAAEKMARDAQKWADQAGDITKTPVVWVTKTTLYRALVERFES